jgi:signal transduction histidine kinase
VDVAVAYGEREVEVRVTDDGRGPNGNGAGAGILGMTERATSVGGTLDAGPGEHGGFRVLARLPLGGGS